MGRSDKMWSTGEGNGKPLQHSCLENPMNSIKRQKEIEYNTDKQKDILYSWIRRIIVTMAILPKGIYRFNRILIQISMLFFTEIKQTILKVTWKHKRRLIAKANFREDKIECIIHPEFKLYYKAIAIKIVCYWHKKRHVR